MALAVEDIWNAALRRIGYATPVGFAYDGSKAGRVILDVYGQTRDDLLKAQDWPFARRNVTLVSNAATPPYPWAYEYTYPTDCLKIRYVQPQSGNLQDPRPVLFDEYNDQTLVSPAKTIVASITPATLVYTAQIVDPTQWEQGYLEALITELAVRLIPALDGNTELLRTAIPTAEKAEAVGIQSQVNYPANPMQVLPAMAEQRK